MAVRPKTIMVRVSEAGLKALDETAAKEERTRSDMARVLLAEAIAARAKAKR